MSKSIYSLVLNDQVVQAIDAMACKRGVSRSNMINILLAQCVSCDTPELRYGDLFDSVGKLIEGHNALRFVNMPSHNMACMVSVLPYRYNPTIRYQLELADSDNSMGVLRVSLRTTNDSLKELLDNFFGIFNTIENKVLDYNVEFSSVDGKYVRTLYDYAQSQGNLSQSLVSYIDNLYQMMRVYLGGWQQSDIVNELYDMYTNYANHNDTL